MNNIRNALTSPHRISAAALLVCVMTGCTATPSQWSHWSTPFASGSSEGTTVADETPVTVRGQSPQNPPPTYAAGSQSYTRGGMPASGQVLAQQPVAQQPVAQQPIANGVNGPWVAQQPVGVGQPLPQQAGVLPPPPGVNAPVDPNAGAIDGAFTQPPLTDQGFGADFIQEAAPLDLDVYLEEERTGRFMFGVGVNSDAGVTGQITLDERNFDITKVPTRLRDFGDGTAFRGAGQGFRLEAAPGNQVQRYLVSFTEPFFLWTPFSLNVSGYLFDRRYVDWDEQRLGGRLGFGYRMTPDLSLNTSVRMENVDVHDPRVVGVPELDAAVGDQDLYVGTVSLAHDTRDVPFFPTQGHYVELSYSQGFGEFDFPRGEIDLRRYFLIRERADGSGRHTFSTTMKVGLSGAQTPIFENFFAGGFSSLRGFDFRGAGPVESGVAVGGEFRLIGSFEYIFPLTADDMMRGLFFVDYGTVEKTIKLDADTFRVAPGFGFRIAVPALGPAPLALDFAFPVAYAETDDRQVFSFFFGFNR